MTTVVYLLLSAYYCSLLLTTSDYCRILTTYSLATCTSGCRHLRTAYTTYSSLLTPHCRTYYLPVPVQADFARLEQQMQALSS